MTPYRVDECVVYAVTDMVRYHPGWAAPLMFASSLLKGMIITHFTPPLNFLGWLATWNDTGCTQNCSLTTPIWEVEGNNSHLGSRGECSRTAKALDYGVQDWELKPHMIHCSSASLFVPLSKALVLCFRGHVKPSVMCKYVPDTQCAC